MSIATNPGTVPNPITPSPAGRRIGFRWLVWIVLLFMFLGTVVILIWALFFSDITINLGADQDAHPTVLVQQPQADLPPRVEPTSISPAPTELSYPTPSSDVLPNGVTNFLVNAEIIARDKFTTRVPAWEITDSGLKWSGGVLEMTGQPIFATGIYREQFEKGQAILYLVESIESDQNINFMIQNGDWQTPNYYRYGFNLASVPVADVWDGTQNLGGNSFQGGSKLEWNEPFYVLLALDDGGWFAAIIWSADNPSSKQLIRLERKPDLPADGWGVAIQVDAGRIKLDDFYLLKFSGYAF